MKINNSIKILLLCSVVLELGLILHSKCTISPKSFASSAFRRQCYIDFTLTTSSLNYERFFTFRTLQNRILEGSFSLMCMFLKKKVSQPSNVIRFQYNSRSNVRKFSPYQQDRWNSVPHNRRQTKSCRRNTPQHHGQFVLVLHSWSSAGRPHFLANWIVH